MDLLTGYGSEEDDGDDVKESQPAVKAKLVGVVPAAAKRVSLPNPFAAEVPEQQSSRWVSHW